MSDWKWKISREKILEQLGFPDGKIPADHQSEHFLYLVNENGEELGKHCVYINKHVPRNGRKHRIMILCKCEQHVPFGRFHQHKSSCKA